MKTTLKPGDTFTRWRLICISPGPGNKAWKCKCECGTVKRILQHSLVNGDSKSCGCYCREKATTHGLTKTPLYRRWVSMKQRCDNPKNKAYKNYGGRGIKVCRRWLKFENFLADMGTPSPGLSLERKNNNGNYTPKNCRWATGSEQCRNTRRNHLIEAGGLNLCIAEWSERLGSSKNSIHSRLRKGMMPSEAVTKPIQQRRQKLAWASVDWTKRSGEIARELGCWESRVSAMRREFAPKTLRKRNSRGSTETQRH